MCSRSAAVTNGQWEPPGGVLELELVLNGLVREVLEETGLTIEPGPLTGVYKNMDRGIVALVFRCSAPDEEPSTSAEALEVRLAERRRNQRAHGPGYAVRMLDALREGPPAIRSHDGVTLVSDAEQVGDGTDGR